MTDQNDLKPLLRKLISGQPLNEDEAFEAFDVVMTGRATNTQIGALLTALATRPGGPTVDELVGAARVMRLHVNPVRVPENVEVIDTCGTGGDHAGTFNVSTAAALIAAGAGAYVAKHGNRSVTSRSGSSQVLEQLGVKLAVSSDTQTRCLCDARLCFCFAPAHHPAMKYAAMPRQELGFRTIFNLLGPLTNPALARRQVMGVYDPELTDTIAQVLARLGSDHAMVVHGSGLDEITTTGSTRVSTVRNGKVETVTLAPEDLGLQRVRIQDLVASGVEESAQILRDLLAGQPGPARDITALNAAAALVVAGLASDLPQGLDLARQSLDTGAAREALARLVELTNEG